MRSKGRGTAGRDSCNGSAHSHLRTGNSAGRVSSLVPGDAARCPPRPRLPGSPECALLPQTPGVRKHSQDSEHWVTSGELRPPTLARYRRPSGFRPSTATCRGAERTSFWHSEAAPSPLPRQGRSLGGLSSQELREGDTKPLPVALGVAWPSHPCEPRDPRLDPDAESRRNGGEALLGDRGPGQAPPGLSRPAPAQVSYPKNHRRPQQLGVSTAEAALASSAAFAPPANPGGLCCCRNLYGVHLGSGPGEPRGQGGDALRAMEEIPILGLGTWKVRRPLGRRGAVPSFDTRLRGEPSTWGHLPQPPQVQMAAGTWKGPTSGFWKMECLDIRFSRIEDCPSQSLIFGYNGSSCSPGFL